MNCWHERKGQDPIAHSTVKNHVNKFMKIKKKKTEKVQSGSPNSYSPWCHASFHWNKQLAIRHGTLDLYTVKDPPLPPLPPGAKEQWIELYSKEKQGNCQHLNAFTKQLNNSY
eukprot:15092274-Ditylum_brightwellii.AAC.1